MKEITKEILSKLPATWSELKFSDFIKLTSLEISDEEGSVTDGIENSIKAISILTDVSIEELENLPLSDLQLLGNKLSFSDKLPEPKKTSNFKWKMPDEISYGDFILFSNWEKKNFEAMPTIIKAFNKEEFTEEQISNLPMIEIITGFFLLRKQLKKFINRTKFYLKVQLLKMKVKELIGVRS